MEGKQYIFSVRTQPAVGFQFRFVHPGRKDEVNMEMRDYGEDCEMIDIQTIEGSAVWDKSALPQKITGRTSFRISGENYSPGKGKLKFRIMVKDEKSQTHTFEFEKSETGRWVRKIFD